MMKLVGKKTLIDFGEKHADVRSQIDAWIAEAKDSDWKQPSDIKKKYASVTFLKDNYLIFNLKGNKYRLKVQVSYSNQIIFIKKVGTHNEYINW